MPYRVPHLLPTRPLLLLGLLVLWATIARGQVIWDNGGGNNQWGTANNWNPNAVPTSSSDVQFNATANTATVGNITLGADRAANSLIFNNVDDSFSISGANALSLTSRTITRTAGSSGNQTLSFTSLTPQNAWDAGWTWNINGSGSLTISSAISGGYADNNKNGTGTLILSGNNTFSGNTNINAGTLIAASDTALGSATYGNTVASGATLGLQGNITLNETGLSVQGTGVGGTGAINNISGNNTFSGTLILAGDTTVASTAGSLTVTSDLALNNNLTVTGAGNVTFSGGGYGGGNITQNGTGTLTFSGTTANSFNGVLNINSGTVALDKSDGTAALASSTINIGDGTGAAGSAVLRLDANNQISDNSNLVVKLDGNFNLNGHAEGVKTLNVSGTGQTNVGSGGALTVGTSGGGTSVIGGTVNLGGGSLTLAAGTNTLNGTVNVAGGAMNFTGGTNTVNGTVNLGGGTMNFSAGTNSIGGTFAGAGTLKQSGGTLALLSNIVNASLDLQLSGGTLALSGFNLTAGTLHVTGNSTIDFGTGSSKLNLTNLVIDANVTLTVTNWTNAAEYFYTQGWTGATFDTSGTTPMTQVVFSGVTGDTHWQSIDHQVTPVPEPSTYGALLLLGAGGLAAWRRFRAGRRG